VDFPWSMCATMQKLRIRDWSTAQLGYALARRPSVRPSSRSALVDSAAVANIKSQIKRNRQNQGRELRNKSVRSALKTEAKKVRAAAASGDAEAVQAEYRRASRGLDKAVSRGALHKRTAARRKSRLARSANRAAQAQ
jgi:small subunit ribosomal protein S20